MIGSTGLASAQDFRAAMGRAPTGVSIITSADSAGEFIGLTVNSLAALSLVPPLVTWALRVESPLAAAFRAREAFVITLLASHQAELSSQFARTSGNRFAGVATELTSRGLPRIADAAAYLECDLHSDLVVGDHVLFVGTVRAAEVTGHMALGYCGGRYFDPSSLGPEQGAVR